MADSISISNETPDMSHYEQEMASKVVEEDRTFPGGIDQGPMDETVAPPNFRPEKFQSDEDWRKSYDELERRFHQSNQQPQDNVDEGLDIPQVSGVNMQALSEEYAKIGKLSDKSYNSLAQAGIDRATVDTYLHGIKALGEQIGNQVRDAVGGTEEYSNMVEWARLNYTPEQVRAYDAAVNSGDVQAATLAAKGLRSDYLNDVGSEGKSYGGDFRGNDDNELFHSNSEVVAAMSDPRYEHDSAYQQMVRDKLAKSDVFSGRQY